MKKSLKLAMALASAIVLQGCVGIAAVGIIGGATVATDKRTVGQQIDDQSIEIDGYDVLSKHEGISDNTNIHITSMNGSLLVVGQAPNAYLRDEAIKLLSNLQGVKTIHNQLRVANITSISTRSNDVWLTSKVKTALFGSDNLEATNIKVVTENAEVFLMGLVTQAEANEAIEIARNIKGVNRVFKAFEYM